MDILESDASFMLSKNYVVLSCASQREMALNNYALTPTISYFPRENWI
ncbi:unnamed protein product [Larinioides sclopetarius]|uniref:Uncharacterized protein n=1 Tax=Larinioides sclopetarius TaxID=280406 RepID=A0AAV1YZ44_9ARAC